MTVSDVDTVSAVSDPATYVSSYPASQGSWPPGVRNGLTCVQAVSRYLFGFYDGIPPPIGTRYHLPMDVLHSWASVKGAVERREMVAMSEGIASVFHIRHILYGETVPIR